MLRILGFLGVVLGAVIPANAADAPAYALVEEDGNFELRQYPALLAAETLVTGTNFDDAGTVAFRRLFRYISGNNQAQAEISMTTPVVQAKGSSGARKGEKIAMTTPVIQQPGQPGDQEGAYRVAFLVPAGYTRQTVPEPLDPTVYIVVTPPRLMATWRYSGRASEELNTRQEKVLRAELSKRKLVVAGEALSAQYNAPFIPGPFRRNEILIPVTRLQESSPLAAP